MIDGVFVEDEDFDKMIDEQKPIEIGNWSPSKPYKYDSQKNEKDSLKLRKSYFVGKDVLISFCTN